LDDLLSIQQRYFYMTVNSLQILI